MFKILPEAEITWQDAWIGVFVTSLLFSLGKAAIGICLGNGAVASAFGTAGSLVLLLLWIYYSAQILFFGAEFTQVYANQYGSKITPEGKEPSLTEASASQARPALPPPAALAISAREGQLEKKPPDRARSVGSNHYIVLVRNSCCDFWTQETIVIN